MSAVQFNLLPEFKLRELKDQQTSRQITTIAILVSAATLALFVILFVGVNLLQKSQLSGVDKDVQTANARLKEIEQLDRILTVQNQLTTLSDLHAKKHISSRLFSYLTQVTPPNAQVSGLSLDLLENNLQIDGTADSQTMVNSFIDTLKFTTYGVGSQGNSPAFNSVTLSSFSISLTSVTFTLEMKFDPQLFSNGVPGEPKLEVKKEEG